MVQSTDPSPHPDESTIEFATLRHEIEATRTPSSARAYLSMLTHLEQFAATPRLLLADITADYVSRFSLHLLAAGLSPSTVKLYRKMMRAMLKPHLTPDIRRQAFAEVDSLNETDTNTPGSDALRRILSLPLESNIKLRKIRDIFLYSIYSGGTPLSTLRQQAEEGGLTADTPQLHHLLQAYKSYAQVPMTDTLRRLTDDEYRRCLAILAEKARISSKLTERSAADIWIAEARDAGIRPAVIAAAAGMETPFTRLAAPTGATPLTAAERSEVLRQVSGRRNDLRRRWYAMRSRSHAADTLRLLSERLDGRLKPETFHLPAGDTPRAPLLETLLFFRCLPAEAAAIKRTIATDAYVYSSRTDSRQPTVIPDREIHTFMLLADIAPETIREYFPADADADTLADFTQGRQALITNGNLSGQVGIITRIDSDTYEVELEFSSLGGARVRARVPAPLLRPL